MNRFWEILFGLDRGFLSREGQFDLRFNPNWPAAESVGNATWNVLLIGAAVALVVWIYRREGKTRRWRLTLGAIRLSLLLLLVALLNRPVLTLSQTRVEPSVLAVLVDDSMSMSVNDIGELEDGASRQTRLAAAKQLLVGPTGAEGEEQAGLLGALDDVHDVRLYRFSADATPLESQSAEEAVASVEASGQSTQVGRAIQTVLRDLQGQHLAGVVVLTDGRDTPAAPAGEALAALKDAGVQLYPVAVGGGDEPRNVDVQSVVAQETAFAGDMVNVVVDLRAAGFGSEQPVTVRLKEKESGQVVLGPDGRPVEATVDLADDVPGEAELQLATREPGTLDLVVEAEPLPGEIDEGDNRRPLQIEVLDAQISVLYVDGYPRWEYRYLKNEMIRDSTVSISILLTSADPTFRQEGDVPIQRFPVTSDELLAYDVVLFGDVSPQQFSDGQLQLVEEFVGDLGGGFGMVAGPRHSPWDWRGTSIEAILPVDILSEPNLSVGSGGALAAGWRPVLTPAGEQAGMFRFFADREENERYLAEGIQQLFWYATGVSPKAGVGETFAHHPDDLGPDGRPAPLLVVGRYGAGRTLFNAIDESWRWRFYTGEQTFDTFWVQQLRYLARGRKLGERQLTLTARRPSFELGEQVRLDLRVLDPRLATQLPDRLDVELTDAQGKAVGTASLERRRDDAERYTASFPAQAVGNFTVTLPAVAPDVPPVTVPVSVAVPQQELSRPRVDRPALVRLADETGGQLVELSEARTLPSLIQSAEKRIPVLTNQALWDAPLALALFVLLITSEWVLRKIAGLV